MGFAYNLLFSKALTFTVDFFTNLFLQYAHLFQAVPGIMLKLHKINPIAARFSIIHMLYPLIGVTAMEIQPGEVSVSHTIRDKKKLLTRVRRIRGQAEALEKALNTEVESNDVLQQIAAIRGAVNGLMTEVLDGHIREHLADIHITPEHRAKDLEQVSRILRSYLK